jgi:hypothetical protein
MQDEIQTNETIDQVRGIFFTDDLLFKPETIKPINTACPLTVDEEGDVTTVIHKHVRAIALGPGHSLLSAPPVLLEGLALPCEHGSGVTSDSSGSVILGGEDVARAPTDLGTKCSEGLDQDSGLDRHMQGTSNLASLEWLGSSELLAARHQTGHLRLGHLDLKATEVGLADVLDLVLQSEKQTNISIHEA